MKRLTLLSGVAAIALLAGPAMAQAPQNDRAPAAQQKAPAEKVAPAMKDQKAPETTGQATQEKSGAAPSPGMKAEDAKPSTTTGQAPSGADSKTKADSKSGADMKAKTGDKTGQTDSKSSTTGQGAAAGAAKLSTEQQAKITTTFKSAKIQSVPKSQINVSISIGTRLPATVHYTPIPAEVVTIYPQWRGYYVILVDGQYIIVEPRTHEIVYIIV